MNKLEQMTAAVFAKEGVLARASRAAGANAAGATVADGGSSRAKAGVQSSYQVREGQQHMAQAVARAIGQRTSLVVEAGTGVGKTFAYLVPAVLSGARVVVSTATKTLQDQLFARDLPAVIDALGVPVRTALLKGRSSYLCLYRMEMALHGTLGADRVLSKSLALVERWSQTTSTGDLTQMPGMDERSRVWPLVTSTRENCLGSDCPKAKECYVSLARKEALACDVVVVNHHLFFADMAVRESGVAQILPTTEVVIFDEAHQINEIGVAFMAKQLGTAQLLDFSQDLVTAGLQYAQGLVQWQTLEHALEYATKDLRLVVGHQKSSARLAWDVTANCPEGVDTAAWQEALQRVLEALQQAHAGLALVIDMSPEFARLSQRSQELMDLAHDFLATLAVNQVRWLEAGAQIRLLESPLDIAGVVRARWFPDAPAQPLHQVDEAGDAFADAFTNMALGTAPANAAPSSSEEVGASLRSWIFTSATLGSDENLSWFLASCGLQDLPSEQLEVLRVNSPFNYEAQSALYVPSNFPRPNAPEHSECVAQVALEAAQILGGRTLVLTTTLRALEQIGRLLTHLLADSSVRVLIQGQQSKRELVEQFRQPNAASVLVASSSFWEGVDIAGHALQCVVIDKLPFPPPGDPLVDARKKRLEAQGRSSFYEYFLPEAAIALKQGAGRLIRSESDIGALAVCDPRLVQMGYGRRLMAALPTMPVLHTAQSWRDWLGLLRSASGEGAGGRLGI